MVTHPYWTSIGHDIQKNLLRFSLDNFKYYKCTNIVLVCPMEVDGNQVEQAYEHRVTRALGLWTFEKLTLGQQVEDLYSWLLDSMLETSGDTTFSGLPGPAVSTPRVDSFGADSESQVCGWNNSSMLRASESVYSREDGSEKSNDFPSNLPSSYRRILTDRWGKRGEWPFQMVLMEGER